MRLPDVGELFERKYELREVLGRGGFAVVYRAHDLDVGRDVAVKVLIPNAPLGYRKDVASRFMREARVVASLVHPATITMFDFGRAEGGLLYMVFEYVRGERLSDVLARGPVPIWAAIRMLTTILDALDEAHQQGVVHRDVKPDNVIVYDHVGEPYRVKLIDFGIAKPFVTPSKVATNLTSDGMVVGTPRYMAPEQFFGETLSPATDVYCVGLVAYELLAGRRAMQHEAAAAIVGEQLADRVALPAFVATPTLRSVVDTMLRARPGNRFPTAGAALAALRAASDVMPLEVAEQAATAPRVALGSRMHAAPAVDPEPSIGARLATGVVIGLAICGGLAVVLTAFHHDDPPRHPVTLPPQITTTPAVARPPVAEEEPPEVALDVGVSDAGRRGCGAAHAETAALRSFTVELDHGERSWTTYIPRGYVPDREHPVWLLFHRTSRSGNEAIAATAIADLANERGFLVIAPDAGEFVEPWKHPDDLALVKAALGETARMLCVDRTRIYALGDGAGGRFARNLPCSLPLSAVATTASGQYPDEPTCSSDPPTPFIRLYGALDRDIPPEGGPGCLGGEAFMSADAIAAGWRTRNGCRGPRKPWMQHGKSRCWTWACDAPVVTCALDGGHEWPTAPPPVFKLPLCKVDPPDFPMLETIGRFFGEHGRKLDVPDLK